MAIKQYWKVLTAFAYLEISNMTIKITKQLATIEDLAIGVGSVVQERNGVPLTLTKIDLITKAKLASENTGEGASLVSMEGGPTVEDAVLDRVISVTSIAAIEAYSAPVGYVFSLNAGGRSGVFDVIAGDFSTELTEDTLNGVYVGLSDDPTATTKVIKRRYIGDISVKWFGADDKTLVSDSRASMQAAIDYVSTQGGDLVWPAAEYEIAAALVVNGMNDYAMVLKGYSGAKITLTSTTVDETVFLIKATASYGRREKLFTGLDIRADNAEGQSCFKYEYYTLSNWGTEAPFMIEKCRLHSIGYNINYGHCQWAGDSYIKESQCSGGGFMKAKVNPNKWIGGVYPHSFSNLSVEDVHFSTTGGYPVDSLLYLDGAQNTYIMNLTLEGAARDFANPASFEATGRGSYLHITGGSVIFDAFWPEHGGTDDLGEAPELSFEGIGKSTAPGSVQFNNCYHISKKLAGSRRDTSSSYITVTINGGWLASDPAFNFSDGSFLILNAVTFRLVSIEDLLANNKNLRITNSEKLRRGTGNATTGPGLLFGNSHQSTYNKKLYEWTGGHVSNDFGSFKRYSYVFPYHYPHHNPSVGYSIKVVNEDAQGYFLGLKEDDTNAETNSGDIVFPVTLSVAVKYKLHHHETDRVKLPFITRVNQLVVDTAADYKSLMFTILNDIDVGLEFFNNYHVAEIVNLQVAIGENTSFSTVGKVNCRGDKDIPEERGTFIPGDEISYIDKTTNSKLVCTSGGTEDLNPGGTGEVRAGELRRFYVADFDSFKFFIGGEFITVDGTACRILDYTYGTTDADNYFTVDVDLVVGTSLAYANSAATWRSY